MNSTSKDASQLELDALRALHDGYLQRLHASSERQFRTVLQTLTLNVAVVVGLVGVAAKDLILSEAARWASSVLLGAFNGAVIWYLLRQGTFYVREREEFKSIRGALLDKCPSIKPQERKKDHCACFSLWSGSGLFCVAVALAALCAIAAFWIPLVASQNP